MSFVKDFKSSLDNFVDDIKKPLHDIREKIVQEVEGHTQHTEDGKIAQSSSHKHRFSSFVPQRENNSVKWYVDACGYMWAVSVAIQEARESIWILDWWLSPELYLRRPPSQNEDFRIDRMLVAAAKRGVKINIIVYKEVAAVLTICSEHTKKALELHPNIAVFRHPDHKPTGQAVSTEFQSTVKNFSFNPKGIASLPVDALKAIFGAHEDIVLYWAHHEKLCLIDRKIAFMGGLDLCYGRWDTNDHPIADAHPKNIDDILFPGQDFNNARIYDFENVENYMNNKLDRNKSSRMGWSDVSICLSGPIVDDLGAHFVQRWNFIFNSKYSARKDPRYYALTLETQQVLDYQYNTDEHNKNPTNEYRDNIHSRGIFHHSSGEQGFINHGISSGTEIFQKFRGKISTSNKQVMIPNKEGSSLSGVQLVRSCSEWSHGVSTENSISNAYIDIILQSKHYVYIENQFFITATDDNQRPVRNKIGAAIVTRVVRAYNEGQKFKVIVLIPAVPAFAGDLHSDDSLGTRAIMEFQYHSICRNGHSIIEKIHNAGVPDANEYIRFYNLRNFDRINAGAAIESDEQPSGVRYEETRTEHYDICRDRYGRVAENDRFTDYPNKGYDHYQQFRSNVKDDSKYDSISQCYMESSTSVTNIPWSGTAEAEFDAYVSEELYIHSKLLIADDRIVICGSANLNDRSQLGNHDSEIAVVIEDPTPIESFMDGRPYQASAFATSLRRQIFRKHLGLIPAQDPRNPTANFLPIDKCCNDYDWNSSADRLVCDPLSEQFSDLWNRTARTNTEVFARAFHVVPADNCRNWDHYKEWYEKFFVSPSSDNDKEKIPPKYEYGHLVKEEFPGGVNEAKEWLSRIRGSLVEMPLNFMNGIDFAVAGVKLNAITQEIYT